MSLSIKEHNCETSESDLQSITTYFTAPHHPFLLCAMRRLTVQLLGAVVESACLTFSVLRVPGMEHHAGDWYWHHYTITSIFKQQYPFALKR